MKSQGKGVNTYTGPKFKFKNIQSTIFTKNLLYHIKTIKRFMKF